MDYTTNPKLDFFRFPPSPYCSFHRRSSFMLDASNATEAPTCIYFNHCCQTCRSIDTLKPPKAFILCNLQVQVNVLCSGLTLKQQNPVWNAPGGKRSNHWPTHDLPTKHKMQLSRWEAIVDQSSYNQTSLLTRSEVILIRISSRMTDHQNPLLDMMIWWDMNLQQDRTCSKTYIAEYIGYNM